MRKYFALLASMPLILASCSDDDNDPVEPGGTDPDPIEYSSGTADFSNYVSLGNSLTAGFSDGALFAAGQTASYPNMLATSFAEAGGGDFNIPFMADDLGGARIGTDSLFGNRFILSFATGSPIPVRLEGPQATDITNILSGSFNNMGVPGATSFHLLAPGYGSLANLPNAANPYYVRFASSPEATILGDAAAQGATFFTLWIGNNDILGYATSGGAGIDQTDNPNFATYGPNDISDQMVVRDAIDAILETMTANGAGGAIANLPDVTTIPYFTTVPHNPVPLDEDTAALLNSPLGFANYNQGLAAIQAQGVITAEELERRTISFSPGEGNAVVLIDEDLTDLTGFNPGLTNMRQATEDDLIVLPALTFIGSEVNGDPTLLNGISVPLGDQWVLTPEEQLAVTTATAAYNTSIQALAAQYDLAFVDANAFLTEVATEGIPLSDGSTVTAVFATGGGFSLDGIHPSPRGYALLANLFIDAIEEKYDAELPRVDPLEFTGLYIN